MLNNDNFFINQRGTFVYYGLNVQLMHKVSDQFLQLSKKSAEEDKTCLKLELTSSPVPSRVTF